MTTTLAIRRSDLRELVRNAPFVALPREEIDRLYAGLEVRRVDEGAQRDADMVALRVDAVIHHNYSWVTFRLGSGERALVRSSALLTDGSAPLFLDEAMLAAARREVKERIDLDGEHDIRLAGLLQNDHDSEASGSLGLLMVVRLTGRVVIDGGEWCGSLELLSARGQFDRHSQVVIDHLEAL